MTKTYFGADLVGALPGDLLKSKTNLMRRHWYVKAKNADGSLEITWAWYLEPWMHYAIGGGLSVGLVGALAIIARML